ncbi:MAG TPA: hypothetical protein VLH75_07275 [Longimicrobiales bacterium]|nr:hypothetical protein [Longimicrobiales bacterium]
MANFDEWTFEDAQEAIAGAIELDLGSGDAFSQNHAFVEEHDHWQDGDGWVGPNGGDDVEVQTAVLANVERQFTPRDAIGEVLNRMANALLRQEPDVAFVPLQDIPDDASEEVRAARDAEVAELRGFISTWWDRKKLWSKARLAAKRSRWSTRGALRTWIAPGDLIETDSPDDDAEQGAGPSVDVLPQVGDFAEALAMVQLFAPAPDSCHVYTDEETQERVAIFLFEDEEEERQKAELWWVDAKGRTNVRIVSDGEGADAEDPIDVDLGGRLPISEMEAELLITEPIRRQQMRLNFAESLMVRIAETAGFPERYTTNAEPGGIWLESAPSDGPALKTVVDKGRTWYLHPAPRTLGAAITTDLIGVVMKSGEGETRATPGVVFKDPTDPEFAIKAARHGYRTILEECKQGHILQDGTQSASGIAYEQARADYEDDLNDVRRELEALVRDTIEVALAWADAMMLQPKKYLERYRVSVTLKVKSGPVTTDEQKQNNENVKAGTMSTETAIARNGIEDVDAELERLRSSPEAVVALRIKQVAGVMDMAAEGVPLDLAAEIVGVTDPELLTKFKAAEKARAEPKAQAAAQDLETEEAAAALLAGTAAAGAGA